LPASLTSLVTAPTKPISTDHGYDEIELPWRPPAVVSDEQRTDAQRAIPAIEARLRPAEKAEIAGRVMVALAHHYVAKMPDAVHRGIASDWCADLGEYPMWAIEAAFAEWRRTQDKKPTIAGIRRLCWAAVKCDSQTLQRLRVIASTPTEAGRRAQPKSAQARVREIAKGAVKPVARARPQHHDEPPMSMAELERRKAEILAEARQAFGTDGAQS
jgi:hypothetical protein